MKRVLVPALLTLGVHLFCADANAGAYIVANETDLDIRSHARNVSGLGGEQEPIRVCIDVEVNAGLAIQAEPAVLNVIDTFNRLRSLARHTVASGADADLPASQYDFESTLLHEMLHAHGVAHPNHADEAGLAGDAYYGTKSADGPNNAWNQNAGADGIHGSADDVRGDDVNLHWFQRNVNNPGVLPDVIDETTMARTSNQLPAGHLFAANGNRGVLAGLGYADAEAAAVQGARAGEAQRHLQHDDVATLRLARAGLDGIAGTADDYRTKLVYVGRHSNPQGEACQIPVRFDNSTAFASTSIGSFRITPNHWGIMSVRMRFNAAVNWFMSAGANTVTTIVSDLPDASAGTQPIAVRVNVAKAAGNPIAGHPLGVVEVRDGPRTDPNTVYCTITLAGTANETGECELAPTISGNKLLTAEYLGYGGFDGSSDTETHVAAGAVQFSAIGSSADPVAVGAPLDVHWTLAPPFGAPPLAFGGTVTVKDATHCALPPADPAHQCTATVPNENCSITFGTPGSRDLLLCYDGDGAAQPTSASLAQNVIAGAATTTSLVQVTPSSAAPLTPVTVSVAVNETPDQGGRPAGVVEVRDGPAQDLFTSSCRIALQGNPGETGTCTLTPTQAGLRTLSANFAAQGRWAASAATTPLAIGQLRVARNVPNVARRGQGVSVTVDLDVSPFLAQPAPTGVVTVSDGVDSCQIALPANECLWRGTTDGMRQLVASWPGDANYAARTSAPVGQQVVEAQPELVSGGARSYPDANGASYGNRSALSANGRYLVFMSDATTFAPGDGNGLTDIFVRDNKTGLIRRVNTSSAGVEANGTCADPSISGNGRYVVFSSLATNLVPGDTNNVRDVFLKDLVTDSTVRVSVQWDGSQATVDNEFSGMPSSISADGRQVAFLTFARLLQRDANIHSDIYVKDMQTGELDLVSTAADETLANFRNHSPAISPDGRYVAFMSQASNFVPEDTTITGDVYLKDRVTRSIRLVSTSAAGTSGGDNLSNSPVVSAGGRYVAFMSYAHNLITPDINYTDIYVKDMQTDAIERANADAAGNLVSNDADLPSISADGRYVAFQSKFYAPPPGSMTRVYIKDRQTGQLARGDITAVGTQQMSGISLAPAISADGRSVSFHSASTGFTPGDINGLADMFVRDLQAGTNQRAALSSGTIADGPSGDAALSRDGRYAIFTSSASNLVDNDTGGWRDVFLYDRTTRATQRVSFGAWGFANADSDSPALSANNVWLAFRTSANMMTANDFDNRPDVFLTRAGTGSVYWASTTSDTSPTTTGTILGPVSLNVDATRIVFRATDTTLVAGDTNGFEDVFVKNRTTHATTLVSASAAGVFGNGHSTQSIVSDDGSRVAFTSLASNLVADDDNGVADVYVKMLADGSVVRASSTAAGAPGNGASGEPSLSADGRYVAFASAASNLVAGDDNGRTDVFVKDLADGSVTRANVTAAGAQGTGGDCAAPSLSADARWISFVCAQAGLAAGVSAGTPHAFVKDRQSGDVYFTSVNAAGQPANAPTSAGPHAIANDGAIVFASAADNLVVGDMQRYADIFVTASPSAPRIATTTAIDTHAPNPSAPGEPYTVNVSVTRAAGSGSITGAVAVGDGSAFCSAPLSGGGNTATGSCALSSAAAGAKSLSAAYPGDAAHAPSNAAAVGHTVVAPAAPSAPFIGGVARGNGQVTVAFQPPVESGTVPIDGYTAECGSQANTGGGSPIVVAGLANGVATTCRVRARNAIGAGSWSAASASVTPATVPAAPRNAAGTRGAAQISVTFDAPLDDGGAVIAGYVARCGSVSKAGPASPIVVVGLTNGVAITCAVAAINDVGEGAPSAPTSSVTPMSAPDAPVDVTATAGNAQASVAFTPPANDGGGAVTSYLAFCGTRSQSGAASPIVVTGLTNGAAVTCRVAARNEIGYGTWSPSSNTVTPANVPGAPLLVGAGGTPDGSSAVLTFNAPADDGGSAITGYDARCTPGAHTASGAASPLTVDGLSAGTAYACTITANNALGAGVASNSVAVTPRILADVAVSNDNGVEFVSGGGTSDWLVDVDNGTSIAVTGARVRMTLPAHLVDIAWVCTAQGGATCPAATGTGSLDGLVNLPAGSRANFLVSATVPAAPEQPLETTATVDLSGAFGDPHTANNSATDGPDAVGVFRSGFE